MSARPGYYSARGVTTSDLNSRTLEELHAGITRTFGEEAAKDFVTLVADVQELSASNFLMALSAFESAEFKWEPQTISYQNPFCQKNDKRRNLQYNNEVEALHTVLNVLGGMGGQNDSRYSIAGAFLESHGTREQVRGLREDSGSSSGYSFGGKRSFSFD